MKQVLTILLGLAVLAFATGGCKSMHDGPRRLESNPTGAKVTVLRLNLELTTPVELPDEVDDDDVLMIELEGYRPLQCTLEDLVQVAYGAHRVELQKY